MCEYTDRARLMALQNRILLVEGCIGLPCQSLRAWAIEDGIVATILCGYNCSGRAKLRFVQEAVQYFNSNAEGAA